MAQRRRFVIVFSCIISTLTVFGQKERIIFEKIYEIIQQDDFFKAREFYALNKKKLSTVQQNFTEAVLDNAFNKLEASSNKIDYLLNHKKSISDSLQLKLYELKQDNAVKLYQYKEAKNAIISILNGYNKHLNVEEISDLKNSLKIWTALESVPAQRIDIRKYTKIEMIKDVAGLNTLEVFANKDSLNFIFDTGANISTTSLSGAKQLKMTIIPVNIEVGAITGTKVSAQLAVCDKLTIGNIDLFNVIFLVLPDIGLSFPQMNYHIFGILGFPIIEALKEIQITQDGSFIVPLKESSFSASSNLALVGLTPLIYINHKHFTFDTGADRSIFYQRFYLENKNEIDKNYQLQKINFGGAGGKKEFDGFKIMYSFSIGKKVVNVKDITLLTKKIKEDENVYGNIGQDLIRKFDKMILNFDQMFIKFE